MSPKDGPATEFDCDYSQGSHSSAARDAQEIDAALAAARNIGDEDPEKQLWEKILFIEHAVLRNVPEGKAGLLPYQDIIRPALYTLLESLEDDPFTTVDAKPVLTEFFNKALYARRASRRRRTELPWARNAFRMVAFLRIAKFLTSINLVEFIERYNKYGDVDSLHMAVAIARLAVSCAPGQSPILPALHHNVANVLETRFARLGTLPDIDGAVVSSLRAIVLTPDEHPDKPMYLNALGNAFRSRFERRGVLSDVEEAVSAHRHAVRRTPDDDVLKPAYLNNLSATLNARLRRLGEIRDLDEMIVSTRRAVSLVPSVDPMKPIFLINFGNSLAIRFEQFNDARAIEDAVLAAREAVALTPNGHPDESARLDSLGKLLSRRFRRQGDTFDVHGAIEAHARAVELTRDDHRLKPTHLISLGGSLIDRFKQFGDLPDIERAVEVFKHALDLLPPDHPNAPSALYNLGCGWQAWLGRSHSQSHFDSAYRCFIDASASPVGIPRQKLDSALAVTRMCTDFPRLTRSSDDLLRAHRSVLDVLPSFVWLGQSIALRYDMLSNFQLGAAVVAAAASAISTGNPTLAVEWLEEGRSVVWSQLNRLQTPIDDLRTHHPNLADELQRVSVSLHTANGRSDIRKVDTIENARARSGTSNTVEEQARHHREIAQAYEELLSRIRAIPSFEFFLRPKNVTELAHACRRGPVAVINTHSSRSDALILCRSGEVIHVPLPGFTEKMAEALRNSLSDCIHGRGSRQIQEDRGIHKKPSQKTPDDDIITVLKLLWLRLVQPVLSAAERELIPSDSSCLPHITWCATGDVAFLPLHAAGVYDLTNPSNTIRASDRVVSSYTPSLSTLLLASNRATTALGTSPRILVISQPHTPGPYAPLPGTTLEAATIPRHFPGCVTHLTHDHAKSSAVIEEMGQHDWIHLACHGVQDAQEPTKSAFLLYDGPLELSQLMRATRRGAELAVLSACQTATGDDSLPEEAVHLAAGMLGAGYRNVVATMWSIDDADGPRLADAFYAALKAKLEKRSENDGELDAAYALHAAVGCLKEEIGESNFVRWVPFVHFGG